MRSKVCWMMCAGICLSLGLFRTGMAEPTWRLVSEEFDEKLDLAASRPRPWSSSRKRPASCAW
jgi:hypothetical protein